MTEQPMPFADAKDLVDRLAQRVGAAVFGQEDLILETMTCFLAGGHILMTGAPGLAKTTLVRVFAKNLGVEFGRVQFTPDLLPSDIIGSDVLNIDPENGRRHFEFAPGPIFTSLLLADEINRATPRTQSALLEAMQERSVTVAGKRWKLPDPFMVFATQNPYESEGTFILPDAQLDRFLLHSLVQFPSEDAESKILREHALSRLVGETPEEVVKPEPAVAREDVVRLMARTRMINVPDPILQGILTLVRSSRPDDKNCPDELKPVIRYGAGPRAGIALVSAVRALALVQGSEEVRWAHVERMVKPVLRHRLRLSLSGLRDGLSEDQVIDSLLKSLKSGHSALWRGTGDTL